MTNYDILKEYEAHQTPVPSYKEWQQTRELMKECKGLLSCLQIDDYDNNGLLVLAKINQALGEEK